ncbi:histone-lysine N-methyltransferase SETMAR [Plakobranchus ocellatus]|uniref:Histone-lysine N-methyltransferase SETMAR n=1 Tax=Plakobranchus ocellatus TaxID=259542 RepID=A0AAV3ZN95_9GAST|nr:histone-lysine N-methyltransferase SETMAR [Plakobranchus ocellatus]
MLFDAKDLDSCVAELSFNTTMQPYTAKRTKEWLERYRWDIISHPAHSTDLALSDFHLFGPLKRHLGGKKFEDEDESLVKFVIDFQSLTQTFSHRVYTRFSRGGKNA